MTRRFNTSQRAAMYLAADGRCAECGRELEPGWHGDHITPYSSGGATDVVNGQALCPACNLTKGSRTSMTEQVTYHDEFSPRPFQQELIQRTLERANQGERATVAIVAPGSGKTLAYQAAAAHLIRSNTIDMIAVYVPRIQLAVQCEIEWRHATGQGEDGYFQLFDERGRIEHIRHRRNNPPLTPPGATRAGFVTTYASLGTRPSLHLEWAAQHRGRFLLVADEAQFCGAARESSEAAGGTVSGELIEQMAEYAAHTLLLTATPYRSDQDKIVLADYTWHEESERSYINAHARADYSDGIKHGYLRQFEATPWDGPVRWRRLSDDTTVEQTVSENEVGLAQVLRQESVWRPIVDNVVTSLRDAQQIHPEHKALIACMEQDDAREVAGYIQRTNPRMRVALAVSDDGERATQALRGFKNNEADILVTVRMAYIGYDHKPISVIGLLTNYRDHGHLMQLVGRALRVWDQLPYDQQVTRIVAPDDPGMQKFLDWLRTEQDQGIREKTGVGPPPPEGPGVLVEDASLTTSRTTGHLAELDPDETRLYETLMRTHGLIGTVGGLSALLSDLGNVHSLKDVKGSSGESTPPSSNATPKTTSERIAELTMHGTKQVRSAVARKLPNGPKDPSYGYEVSRVFKWVNQQLGVETTEQISTVEQAERYVKLCARVVERMAS